MDWNKETPHRWWSAMGCLAAAMLLGCGVGESSPTLEGTGSPAPAGASSIVSPVSEQLRGSWTLVAQRNLSLKDNRCQGESCRTYPNPNLCETLVVTVREQARVTGQCRKQGRTLELTGNSLSSGIPYFCRNLLTTGSSCVVCQDSFGDEVHRDCAVVIEGGAPQVIENSCKETQGADGHSCTVCYDASGRPTSDTCNETTCRAEDGFKAGQKAYVEQLNKILKGQGFTQVYSVRASYKPTSGDVISGMCAEQKSAAASREPVLGFGTREAPGCWLMGTVAGARTCDLELPVCAATRKQMPGTEAGIAAERAVAIQWMRDTLGGCVESPIVLDLDGNGISVRPASDGARFALTDPRAPVSTAWISRGDALLALDRNGNGRIDDGSELFGQGTRTTATRTGYAGDGFAAMRELDVNQDGRLDSRDPSYASLLLWFDDGDAVTQRRELVPLTSRVTRLDLAAEEKNLRSPDGSVLSLWSTFVRRDGSTGAMVDVFFHTPRSSAKQLAANQSALRAPGDRHTQLAASQSSPR